MNCELCREALSARLDGEQEPAPRDAVDRHVAGCALCRSWLVRAERLRRTMTLRSAPAVPDLSDAILEGVPAPRPRGWLLRVALGVVAVAQSTLGLAQLLGVSVGMHGGHGGGFMLGHLTHESAAWNLAVGVGLGWAALRPRLASGQLPVLGGFVLVLAVVSIGDLLGESVTVERLVSHVLLVAGLALLYLVYRQDRRLHPRPATGDALPAGEPAVPADRPAWPPQLRGTTRRGGPYRRPASKRRVA